MFFYEINKQINESQTNKMLKKYFKHYFINSKSFGMLQN